MTIYYVESLDPNDHLFNIRMIIQDPIPKGQILSIPNWIPGSYLFRDYARHIVSIQAFSGSDKSPLSIIKIDSNTWSCDPTPETITIEYIVYAWDLTVEGAYLDQTKGFFNGCALFLMAHQKENERCDVHISPPNCPKAHKWQVATTLKRDETPLWSFGWYYAKSYDDLIDNPVAMGILDIVEFKATNVPHFIAVWGNQDGDLNRLARDLKKICENTIHLFKEPAPFHHYMFLVAVMKGYEGGGLEHRYSSALMVERDCFPIVGEAKLSKDYIYLLSLCSHEYFHAWNVKRIKPVGFMAYNLNKKNYTNQLWAFEGLTSYFGDLSLVRSKVITLQEYLDLISEDLTRLLGMPGRKIQTLTESSFDVWIKYNQPNENSLNSVVNYYTKGKLVGLLFDMALRLQTNHMQSMDEVMRRLWEQYGKHKKGVPEGKIDEIIIALGGQSLTSIVMDALYSTKELPLEPLLAQFGFNLTLRSLLTVKEKDLKENGIEIRAHQKFPFKQGVLGCATFNSQGRVYVSHVSNGSAASIAGISANDEIIAINGIRVDDYSIDKIMKRLKVGQVISIHVFRHDTLMKLKLILTEPPLDQAKIVMRSDITDLQKKTIDTWLLSP